MKIGSLDRVLAILATLAALMLTVVLDSIENHHIMTMVHSIQNGLPISVAEGQLQMVASQVKFNSSYLAVLLFAFGFLQFGRLGRILSAVLFFSQASTSGQQRSGQKLSSEAIR